VYTKLTLADLDHAAESLHHALAERNAAYAKELARQQANDALCKQFAELVEPLSQWIVHQKDTITQSKAELDEQLQYVNERIAKADADGSSLSAIAELEQKIVDAGVTNNRHTNLTHKDADVQFVQYRGFLGKKQKMLENEIEQHKLRGVTAEQLKEIEDNIVQYDSGSKGHLDKKEFKACLYSLGEEKTRNEVDQLIKEHGNGEQGVISHEAFRQYMISVLGVSDTKEDILAGFELINRGHPVGKVELMELVLSPHDLEYIKRTAPAVEGGYDYKAWTEDVFSR
jgi:Ca2+-binding EF-hand superfamily protein